MIALITLLIILLLMILINSQCDCTEKFTVESNEAVQSISSVYADSKGAASFNNLVVNNLTVKQQLKSANLTSLDGTKVMTLGNDGKLKFYDVSNGSAKQYVPDTHKYLKIQIGSSKVPITDIDGSTFNVNAWTCRKIRGDNAVIGVKNNIWWITSVNWYNWINADIELIPIPLNIFYPNYVNDPHIYNDTTQISDDGVINSRGWGPQGPLNQGYRVLSENGIYADIPVVLT